MSDETHGKQASPVTYVLTAHRSLSPRGFVVLMALLGLISFVTGMVFAAIGAWPVLGFFGLDVAIIYLAFRLNYRAGRVLERIELTPERLVLTHIAPSGARSEALFNPYWTRVRLDEAVDGRTSLRLASHGREMVFGRFLNDEERRALAPALSQSLALMRGAG